MRELCYVFTAIHIYGRDAQGLPSRITAGIKISETKIAPIRPLINLGVSGRIIEMVRNLRDYIFEVTVHAAPHSLHNVWRSESKLIGGQTMSYHREWELTARHVMDIEMCSTYGKINSCNKL